MTVVDAALPAQAGSRSFSAQTYLAGLLLLLPLSAFATEASSSGHDPVSAVILWVTLIFSLAIAGRYLARLCHQPGVLGELLMGVLLGNICHFFGMQLMVILREGSSVFNIMRDLLTGVSLNQAVSDSIPNAAYAAQVTKALASSQGIEYIKVGYTLDMFSRYGVIFLLFMVGLESSVEELKHTGIESARVAVIGVIAPVVLGFIAACWLLPEATYQAHLFVAATLSATSIGITARVLSEMKKLRTREARTILGAAMLDDVLGLIILAIVSSVVINGEVNMMDVFRVILSTIVFFTGVLWLGPWVLRGLVRCTRFLDLWEAKLVVAFIFVMLLAWLATVVQLASIIGAFAAGMIMNDAYFSGRDNPHPSALPIKSLVAPLESLLAPLFFMLIGIQVKLESFFDWHVLLMSSGLIAAAVVGKLVSGYGAHRNDDRLLIGIGMLPRGEVGLVFASIGRTLGVMSDQLFAAVILMVIVTTFLAPPCMKARYAARAKREQAL
ncbi:cation:proton antiporter [Legionella sp. CNM-4043-24]|uniref:cation:proton antiporter n=1 Tax=Legionella sp. CNM-4043-24 TaxID=3421646 RepID=UPI00403ACE21